MHDYMRIALPDNLMAPTSYAQKTWADMQLSWLQRQTVDSLQDFQEVLRWLVYKDIWVLQRLSHLTIGFVNTLGWRSLYELGLSDAEAGWTASMNVPGQTFILEQIDPKTLDTIHAVHFGLEDLARLLSSPMLAPERYMGSLHLQSEFKRPEAFVGFEGNPRTVAHPADWLNECWAEVLGQLKEWLDVVEKIKERKAAQNG